MTFSEKIKPLWDKTNLTLEDIASECNVSASMVSRYINGKVVPQADVAEKMLILLGAGTTDMPKIERGDEMNAALTMIRDVYEARIGDMKEEVSDLKYRVLQEKKEKWLFVALLALTVAFVFTLFFIDLTNGNVGWYRY